VKPVVERGDAAGKCSPVMLAERFDRGDHGRSAEETAMTLESLDKTRGRMRFALDCR
jgi:hypothetical protein